MFSRIGFSLTKGKPGQRELYIYLHPPPTVRFSVAALFRMFQKNQNILVPDANVSRVAVHVCAGGATIHVTHMNGDGGLGMEKHIKNPPSNNKK